MADLHSSYSLLCQFPKTSRKWHRSLIWLLRQAFRTQPLYRSFSEKEMLIQYNVAQRLYPSPPAPHRRRAQGEEWRGEWGWVCASALPLSLSADAIRTEKFIDALPALRMSVLEQYILSSLHSHLIVSATRFCTNAAGQIIIGINISFHKNWLLFLCSPFVWVYFELLCA